MEKLIIHKNTTSVDWKPSPIIALATSIDNSKVVAAREDGSLEIWIVSPGFVGWHCQLTIHGDPSVFDVTYRGKHSCLQASHLQTKQKNQCKNQNGDHKEKDQKQKQSQEGLFENFGNGLRIKTEDELLLDSQKLSSSSSFSFPSSMPLDCVKMENCNFSPFDRNYFLSSYHVQLNGEDTNTIHTSNHRRSNFDDAVLLDLVELNQYSPLDYFHP